LAPRKGLEVFFKLIGVGLLAFAAIAAIGYWLTPEADQLGDECHVSKDKIIIEPKPHGCDYNDAPLGNNHCHHEKTVDAARACSGPQCQVTSVYVFWRKVED
jgi:hypothetical protein